MLIWPIEAIFQPPVRVISQKNTYEKIWDQYIYRLTHTYKKVEQIAIE